MFLQLLFYYFSLTGGAKRLPPKNCGRGSPGQAGLGRQYDRAGCSTVLLRLRGTLVFLNPLHHDPLRLKRGDQYRPSFVAEDGWMR